jgi:hypothetical protein
MNKKLNKIFELLDDCGYTCYTSSFSVFSYEPPENSHFPMPYINIDVLDKTNSHFEDGTQLTYNDVIEHLEYTKLELASYKAEAGDLRRAISRCLDGKLSKEQLARARKFGILDFSVINVRD